MRIVLAFALALACAAPAAASPVLVYDNGRVTRVDDPALPAADATNAVPAEPQPCAQSQGLADRHTGDSTAHAAATTVLKAIRRAYNAGAIDRATYSSYR